MRVSLIGYRACGKTTVGRLLSGLLGAPFIDADAVIEQHIGCPIATCFARDGEAAFRDREAECLAALLAGEAPMVLATGGGAVLRAENRALLRARGGLVVYIEVPVGLIQARLRRDAGGRPSLTGAGVAEEAPRLLDVRAPLYRETAHHVIDGSTEPEVVARAIAALVVVGGQDGAGDRASRAPR